MKEHLKSSQRIIEKQKVHSKLSEVAKMAVNVKPLLDTGQPTYPDVILCAKLYRPVLIILSIYQSNHILFRITMWIAPIMWIYSV